MRGLFTYGDDGHERFIRARYPNANPEQACWGYSCMEKDTWSLSSDQVAQWHKPARGASPAVELEDFQSLPNAAGVLKNDSTQGPYNTFTQGEGGICADVWKGKSYWCSNASSGGWAEVDFQAADAGQLQLPVGLTLNSSAPRHGPGGGFDPASRLRSWANPVGAVVAAWHSQTWFLDFFTVDGFDREAGSLTFGKGGSQGGRNWCRCDQCAYAANLWAGHQWCGEVTDDEGKDTRLIGGSWMVENVREELDAPSEYFYNESTQTLFLWPNATAAATEAQRDAKPPASLVVPVLQQLLAVRGSKAQPVRDVKLTGVGLRDAAAVCAPP